MKGSPVDQCVLEPRGLQNDRRYMLVNTEGTFISQRTHPVLSRIVPEIDGDSLSIRFEEKTFVLDIATISSDQISVSVFEHSFEANLVSNEADAWFSDVLGVSVRLVKMAEDCSRVKKLIKGPEQTKVSFADGYPYLIAGTASIDFLNSKLEEKIDINRFRANIIVDTITPHEEDDWEKIGVGEHSEMMVIKPCARCPVVTIDQDTGIKSKEPLKTLASYRKMKNKVNFGANAISLNGGIIKVGDKIHIIEP